MWFIMDNVQNVILNTQRSPPPLKKILEPRSEQKGSVSIRCSNSQEDLHFFSNQCE